MDAKRFGSSAILGLGIIYVVAALISLLFSLILKLTSVQEGQISLVITIISFIALFIGGFAAGARAKEKGWMIGLLTGILYTMINFLFQYLGYDSVFSSDQIIYYVCFILTATMGGILGVNVFGGNTREA